MPGEPTRIGHNGTRYTRTQFLQYHGEQEGSLRWGQAEEIEGTSDVEVDEENGHEEATSMDGEEWTAAQPRRTRRKVMVPTPALGQPGSMLPPPLVANGAWRRGRWCRPWRAGSGWPPPM